VNIILKYSEIQITGEISVIDIWTQDDCFVGTFVKIGNKQWKFTTEAFTQSAKEKTCFTYPGKEMLSIIAAKLNTLNEQA
jgi:hypothetical protein